MTPRDERLRYQLAYAALVGTLAAVISSAVMLWGSQRWGGTLPTQILSDRVIASMPLAVSRRILLALGGDAKPFAFVAITLTQIVAGTLVALVAAQVPRFTWFMRSGMRSRVSVMLLAGAVSWLLWTMGAAPLAGIGWFASDAPGGLWRTQATLVVGALTFGILAASFLSWSQPNADVVPAGSRTTRRRVLKSLALAGLAVPSLLSAAYIGRYTWSLHRKPPSTDTHAAAASSGAFGFEGMPPPITPTGEFYVVSKNFIDPTVDAATWSLQVGGLVDRPLTLSATDVLMHAAGDFVSTLICISNTVGGPYVSTAVWTGFPLRDLLLEAGIQDGVVDLEIRAADGYVESLPIEKAIAPDTMLVHSMNGAPLTHAHGFPLRLIVPGRYGIKNVKWITEMRLVDEDIRGYWQERLWSETAYVETTSRIDTPRRGRRVPFGEVVRIGGIAFAGDRRISRVELSLDDGETWFDVDLMDELSSLAWRLWKYEYTPEATGIVKIAVRATDGTQNLQSSVDREPLPEGATGYHRAWFEVREPGT